MELDSPDFQALLNWGYEDSFVLRLLSSDIPQRAVYGAGRIWVYRDPEENVVGFGTLDVIEDYAQFGDGSSHLYIPLLASNPSMTGRGHGKSIVEHLVSEAAILAQSNNYYKVLYLDVYTTSESAIRLYLRCGFESLTPTAIPDTAEAGKSYYIMGKRVSVS